MARGMSVPVNGWTEDGELYLDVNGYPAYKGSKVWVMGELWQLVGYSRKNPEYIDVVNASGDRYVFLESELEKLPVNFDWS